MRRVQMGFDPNDWKPTPVIGLGAREIRIRTDLGHRIFYVARFREAIYVLHAFQKRSRRTSRQDLALARQRMRMLEEQRSSRRK